MRLGGHTHVDLTPEEFFDESTRDRRPLVTSAEVLQELTHVYLRMRRPHTLDSALELVASAGVDVWPLEQADVMLARQLHEQHPVAASQRPLPPRKLQAARRERDNDLRPGPRRRRIEVGGEARMSGAYADRPWGLFPEPCMASRPWWSTRRIGSCGTRNRYH